MRTLEKEFKDGSLLVVSYDYKSDIDGICDLFIGDIAYYKPNEADSSDLPFGSERVMSYIVDAIEDKHKAE